MRTMYHGWSIHLISEARGYSYQCWDAQQGITISDRRVYSSIKETLKAAQQRADLESVSLSLMRALNDIYGRHCYYLTTEDHSALTASIASFVSSASQTC
jgi:hypothetical protein